MQYVLVVHSIHNCLISSNLASGMEIVLSIVLTMMAKHTTEVDGGTNLS